VTAALGAGGMGEVYRATDTKLGRDVALKLLPAALASDPERLSRFEREARVLASLNHPGIAQLYGFESSALPDGSTAGVLVMELVEGEDLAGRLKRGPIPVDEAVAIARQVAEALEEAHEKGIVHRDLKPANVKVTPDGKVKVLDFGLAKAWSGEAAGVTSSADLSQSPTLAHTGTAAGLILGTAAYMSPEQARGKAVDKRADIWAFGVVLFEMLTGRRLFEGETVTDVLASVVKEPVHWDALPRPVPASVTRLLRRCLERDPKERLRDIGEVRIALGEGKGHGEDAAPAASASAVSSRRSSRWAAGAALLVLGGAIGLGIARMGAPRGAAPLAYHLLTSEDGFIHSARFGPDGETIVYGQAQGGRPVALFSTRADATTSRALDAPSADVVGISRNGQMALILGRHYAGSWMRVGTLAQAALAGGEPRALLEGIYDADVAPDGAGFAVVRSDGSEQRLEYPIGTILHRTNGWISSPRIARDGRRVAFVDHPIPGDDQGTVAVVEKDAAAQKLSEPLNFLHGLAWSADGEEIVASYGTTDQGGILTAFAAGRPPREVLRTIATTRLHDIAASGALLVTADSVPVSIEGRLAAGTSRLGFGAQTGATVEGISDDGTTVVGTDGGLLEDSEYRSFYQRAEGGRVSLGVGGAAGISPDGRRAFVYTLHRDRNKLRVVPTGPGDERVYDLGGVSLEVSSYDLVTCAADGRTIAFLGRRPGEEPRGYVFDLESAKPPRAVTAASVRRLRISPDGRRLAGAGADLVPALYDVASGGQSPIPGAVAGEVVVAWASGSDAVYLWNRELPARVERLSLATGRREPAFEWRPSGSTEGLYGLLSATVDARYFLMRFRGGVSTLAVARARR
jgi:hypothetical protein